jgi:hypothetical protein
LRHIPGASDLLRRIRVSDDLDSVTTAGPEDDPGPLDINDPVAAYIPRL